ncbi:hypothetical protein ZWY2020_058229 [Hordeum vulgare]|nr:hypothetical protein ZWY2020_058229 [Hordeum vulgare]
MTRPWNVEPPMRDRPSVAHVGLLLLEVEGIRPLLAGSVTVPVISASSSAGSAGAIARDVAMELSSAQPWPQPGAHALASCSSLPSAPVGRSLACCCPCHPCFARQR